MNITIIIDKSTFQSLSFKELYQLSSYYKHNITPVLTLEILGDLKKEFEGENKPSKERVIDFANKLFPMYTVVNKHYKELVVGDLMGYHPSLDGRPNVGIAKTVISSSGKKGFIIEESKEEQSIYQWKGGNFDQADHELAQLWRTSTTEETLLTRLKSNLKAKGSYKFKDYQELYDFVKESILADQVQEALLISCLENYELTANEKVSVYGRWVQENKPTLKDFSPYAFHCLLVDSLFSFGLSSDLIGTRPTNRVDMEYLYYLPFCNVFTSCDKVHVNVAPLLLRPYQKFINGAELKKDLKLIVEHLESISLEERRKYKSEPSIITTSMTFMLWQEFFDYPKSSNLNRNLSESEKDRMKKKVDEFIEAMERGEVTMSKHTEDSEFVVKKSYLSKSDPCYCGSGKKVIECCMTEEEFNKRARRFK